MALITKYENQTVFDLLLHNAGAISGLFDFLEANNLTDIDISEGQYLAPEIINQEVVDFFKRINKELSITTGGSGIAHGAPVIVTLNGQPLGIYEQGTENNITLQDEDLNPIIPVSVVDGVITLENAAPSDGWVRNPDWLPLPEVDYGDEVFYGLWAVYEDEKSVNSIQSYNTSTIYWGDGTSQVTSNNVKYTKVYDYASISSDVCVDSDGRNYKQVIVKIEFNANSALWIDRNDDTVINNGRILGWLDISIDMASLTRFGVCEAGKASRLERLVIYNGDITFTNSSWQYLTNLRVLQMDTVNSGFLYNSFWHIGDIRKPDNTRFDLINSGHTFVNYGFSNAKITEFGNVNLPVATNCLALFRQNFSLKIIGSHNLPSATDMSQYLVEGLSLTTTGIFTTSSSLTSLYQAFYNCPKLNEIEFTECAGVTNTTNTFDNCFSLKRLILPNITVGFNIIDCALEAAELDELFTSLGTASGSQTINITRNPGAATCDTSIATAKGFTIVS